MKKSVKIGMAALAVISAACAGGYGVWYAWDNGKIGDNPRAPTPQAMEKAVRMQAAYLAMTTGARAPWMAFLRLNASAAVCRSPTVLSLSRAET